MQKNPDPFTVKNTVSPFLSLFFSAGTLICCALPALMVSLGMGAVLAGWVSTFPQLVWLSQHKLWVFSFAGAMLCFSGFMQWRARLLPCPVDAVQARACSRLRTVSWCIWGFSVLLFAVGVFFAYIAPRFI